MHPVNISHEVIYRVGGGRGVIGSEGHYVIMGVGVLSGEKIVVIVDRKKGVRVKRVGRSFKEFAGSVKIERPGDVDKVVEEERAKDIGY